jgi:hypothetical protein
MVTVRPPPHDRKPRACAVSSPGAVRPALLLIGTVACGTAGYDAMPAGTSDAATAAFWQPTGIPSEWLGAGTATADLSAVGEFVIDTDTATWSRLSNGETVPQPADLRVEYLPQPFPGKELVVFIASSWRFVSPVHARGQRALAFVASGDIEVAGDVDVSAANVRAGLARADLAGAGGFAGGTANNPGQGPAASQAGGATSGASHCTAGGSGSGGGLAPAPYGDGRLSPLVGGSGAAGGSTTGSLGGAGGGAVQFTAGGRILVTGRIRAAGAGGTGTSGGGSGGAILLEATEVIIRGSVSANGGGGAVSGYEGADGGWDDVPASGGADLGNSRAGAGGAGTQPPEDGMNSAGGGGAAGRVLVRSREPAGLEGLISPSSCFVSSSM